ncbi:hypothetical protein C1J00_25565 [Streptomyces cahuitamycinicus]|uniref:Uncharacterized protein n=1 Tax=Streptomyces cahuitamycinicus TaxID=2070367 RepID=A0A2N8TKB7_9ACTN|nr:hypothetical protein C1J00_25565 [Streptomyces cahuitamycinicus]
MMPESPAKPRPLPGILLALLVPALMMAFLSAMDALEDLLFPPDCNGRGETTGRKPTRQCARGGTLVQGENGWCGGHLPRTGRSTPAGLASPGDASKPCTADGSSNGGPIRLRVAGPARAPSHRRFRYR